MPLVNPTLPNDNESADASDISGPLLELLAVFNGHIGADNLEPGTIVDSLTTSSVTTAKLADGAVTTVKIADAAVTPAKVGAANTVVTGTSNIVTPLITSRSFTVTALASDTTINAPAGTPYDTQGLIIRIKDDGTARTLTWNAIYRGVGVTLPTTTVATKELYVSLAYNTPATKWDVLSIARLG